MTRLDELVPEYYENKQKEDELKKVVDAQNKEIKELLQNNEEYVVEQLKAVVIPSTRTSFNEEKMIAILKNSYDIDDLGIVKTKEYVDMDALESAIYNGKLSESVLKQLNECKDEKEIRTLRVTKIKKQI